MIPVPPNPQKLHQNSVFRDANQNVHVPTLFQTSLAPILARTTCPPRPSAVTHLPWKPRSRSSDVSTLCCSCYSHVWGLRTAASQGACACSTRTSKCKFLSGPHVHAICPPTRPTWAPIHDSGCITMEKTTKRGYRKIHGTINLP